MGITLSDDGDDEFGEAHEINVTPFIDVMLVLLIIFMIAAPLATVSVPVDLPVSTAQARSDPQEPLVVTIGTDRAVSLGNDRVDLDALGRRLIERTRGDRTTRIFLRADQTVPYRDIMALMNVLRDAGFLKVALVGLDKGGAAQ